MNIISLEKARELSARATEDLHAKVITTGITNLSSQIEEAARRGDSEVEIDHGNLPYAPTTKVHISGKVLRPFKEMGYKVVAKAYHTYTISWRPEL